MESFAILLYGYHGWLKLNVYIFSLHSQRGRWEREKLMLILCSLSVLYFINN